jgi:hypothetical protein
MSKTRSFTISTVAALLLTACGGSKKDVLPPTTQTPSISVGSRSATLSAAQSAGATAAVTVGRVNFTGDVTLTAEGLPSGVTAVFTPATLASGATSSSVALTCSATATLGAATVTLRARGSGVGDAVTTLAFTVTPAGGSPTISLSLTPATASITAGQSAQTAVTLTRSAGFADGVTMSVTGAPTGMTTSFSSSNPFTGTALTLSVATLTSVTPGTFTLTVRANATGVTEATTTYAVTVGAPPSNSVGWRFCDPARVPLWFAYQDGATGSWQQVTPAALNTYNFSYGQPQVGVTTVTTEAGRTVTRVMYYGVAEITAAAARECTANPAPGTKTVTGTISGFINATEIGSVTLGKAPASTTSQPSPNFTIQKVADGALDLVALRADINTGLTNRALVLRNQNIANNGSLGTLDLAGGTSFAPVTSSITVTAPNDGTVLGRVQFTTLTNAIGTFGTPVLSSGVAATYQAVPESIMLTGELQQVIAAQQVGTTLTRSTSRYIRGPVPVTLAMPADGVAPTVTNITPSPYSRATLSGPLSAAFNDLVTLQLQQATRRWELIATAASRSTTSSYSLTMPDFSAVPGWLNTWGLGSGATEVTSFLTGKTGAGTDGIPILGTQTVSFGRTQSFTF